MYIGSNDFKLYAVNAATELLTTRYDELEQYVKGMTTVDWREVLGVAPEAGFVEAEKAGRLAAQAVGGELRGRLAVEVQPEGITEREAPARGPHGELDPPGADDAVNGEQRQGKKVAHAAVSRSSRPAGR